MSELEVRIVHLPPMRVAIFRAFGDGPELEAWAKVYAWAQEKGWLNSATGTRVFGFNNPDPSPGSPNYGYEWWLVVSTDEEIGGGVEEKQFPGGRYAVTRCKGAHNITQTWHRLATWVDNSSYSASRHQWLEEHLGPLCEELDVGGLLLDLHFPIAD